MSDGREIENKKMRDGFKTTQKGKGRRQGRKKREEE